MARPRSPNPSPEALYRRKLRESKLTPEQIQKREIKLEYQKKRETNFGIQATIRENRLARRRNLYRAWKLWLTPENQRTLTKDGVPYLQFGKDSILWDEAIHILTGEGNPNYPNLIKDLQIGEAPKPSKLRGRVKSRTYLNRNGTANPLLVNEALRKMALANGVEPQSPSLVSKDPDKPIFDAERFQKLGFHTMREKDNSGPSPKIVLPTPYHKREEVKRRRKELAEKRAKHHKLQPSLPPPNPQPEEDPALGRLKALAAAQKSLEEEPSDDIFGDWQDK